MKEYLFKIIVNLVHFSRIKYYIGEYEASKKLLPVREMVHYEISSYATNNITTENELIEFYSFNRAITSCLLSQEIRRYALKDINYFIQKSDFLKLSIIGILCKIVFEILYAFYLAQVSYIKSTYRILKDILFKTSSCDKRIDNVVRSIKTGKYNLLVLKTAAKNVFDVQSDIINEASSHNKLLTLDVKPECIFYKGSNIDIFNINRLKYLINPLSGLKAVNEFFLYNKKYKKTTFFKQQLSLWFGHYSAGLKIGEAAIQGGSCVLSFTENPVLNSTILAYMRVKGYVKTYYYHPMDGFHLTQYLDYHSSNIFVSNKSFYKKFKDMGYKNIEIVGSSRYKSRNNSNIIPIKLAVPKIIYFTKNIKEIDNKTVNYIVSQVQNRVKIKVIIKRHPKDSNNYSSFICDNVIVDDGPLYAEYLDHNYIIITHYSTILREYLTSGIPMLFLNCFEQYEYHGVSEWFGEYVNANNSIRYVTNLNNIYTEIKFLLNSNNLNNTVSSELLEGFFGFLDSNYAYRICSHMGLSCSNLS